VLFDLRLFLAIIAILFGPVIVFQIVDSLRGGDR